MYVIKDGDVVTFHMSNGTNVVAKLDHSDEDGYVVQSPQELMIVSTPQGVRVGFTPYLSYGGIFPELENMVLPYADILMPRPTPDKIEQAYREATGMVLTANPGLVLVQS